MTIREAKSDFIKTLTPPYGEGEARAMSRYVFEDYFGSKNDADTFLDFLIEDFEKIKQRLLDGEPVQYVVGFAWFYGLKFKVNSNVLIPRPETEELVEWILETISQMPKPQTYNPKPISILDIGTGSGCIPITLKVKNPELQISAVDISEGALITASRNAYRMNADVEFKRIDILNENDWTQLPDYQIIVSNPPYIPTREKALMENNVLDHEPHLALFVDDDNALIFYEKIADFALKHLYHFGSRISDFGIESPKSQIPNPKYTEGALFFECNEYNAQEVVAMLKEKGFNDVELRKDMSGKDRMIRAQV
jgi:release factor glutamine methyltransferase